MCAIALVITREGTAQVSVKVNTYKAQLIVRMYSYIFIYSVIVLVLYMLVLLQNPFALFVPMLIQVCLLHTQ